MKQSTERFHISVTTYFDAAHQIHCSGSICERLHGHRWKLTTTFSGPLKENGIVYDFIGLEQSVKERVISKLDHTNLNDAFDQPTTERLCQWIWQQLEPLHIYEVILWETPEYSVTYRKET
jgi:6-pyruvoyltetrahydropterin/6-carboxytetrahydropterin synthase